jgi:hypothetical protein
VIVYESLLILDVVILGLAWRPSKGEGNGVLIDRERANSCCPYSFCRFLYQSISI